MRKLINSTRTRVLGAAVVAASAAAVVAAVAPSLMPDVMAQTGPGSTVEPGPIEDFVANILAFVQQLLSSIFDAIFPIFDR